MESADNAINLCASYQSGAFKLPVRVFMSRAPQKILVVKIQRCIVPASVTTMGVEHPPRGIKLTVRQAEATYQHHRNTGCPCQP